MTETTTPFPAKYARLAQQNFAAYNYDLTLEACIEQLQAWDKAFGIQIREEEASRFVLTFERLPNDVSLLAQEIYRFCPDIVDQGFACMDELQDFPAEELDSRTLALIDGINFDDDHFGLKILERSLVRDKQMGFWWD